MKTLKELREAQGLTTAFVAHELQKADATIRNWEKSRTNRPALELWQFKKLCELYQCSMDELEKAMYSDMTTNL